MPASRMTSTVGSIRFEAVGFVRGVELKLVAPVSFEVLSDLAGRTSCSEFSPKSSVLPEIVGSLLDSAAEQLKLAPRAL